MALGVQQTLTKPKPTTLEPLYRYILTVNATLEIILIVVGALFADPLNAEVPAEFDASGCGTLALFDSEHLLASSVQLLFYDYLVFGYCVPSKEGQLGQTTVRKHFWGPLLMEEASCHTKFN